MKTRYILVILLILFTYLVNITSVLYTESFILFLAFLCILLTYLTYWNPSYKKNDAKWNNTMLFYFILKNWNRSLKRDTDIRIAHFLLLSLQMQKYEIRWMKRNMDKIVKRDYILIKHSTLRRLEILVFFKKQMKLENKIVGLRRLPLGDYK
ncbi:MAG: hypothetical protein ACK4IX_12650 [Candidatus Sericytochromatia bacterium]